MARKTTGHRPDTKDLENDWRARPMSSKRNVVKAVAAAGLTVALTTGIALAVNHWTGIPVSGFVLIFNVLMLAMGFGILGKAFAATTLASTFLYPAALELCERIFGDLVLTEDILLCTVFSGFGIGIALGIVLFLGGSLMGILPEAVRSRRRAALETQGK